MGFGQLFARALSNKGQRGSKKRSSIKKKSSTNIESTEDLLLHENNNLKSINELNEALKDIDAQIAQQGFSDLLLLRRADILIRKRKFKQARQTINNLTYQNNKSTVSRLAKQLLSVSEKLKEQEAISKTRELSKELHQIANKYNFKLSHIVHPDEEKFDIDLSKFDIDLSKLVQKEALQALESELPVLSCELIDKAKQFGQKSPWLVLLRANALSLMGNQTESLNTARSLINKNNSTKFSKSIDKTLSEIQGKPKKYYRLRANVCLAKHLIAIAKNLELETDFLPKIEMVSENSKIKSLIFNKALEELEENPQITLDLTNAILDFAPSDGASLQLKGQALSDLNQVGKAIQAWKPLTRSRNERISRKASISISRSLSKRAKKTSKLRSPEVAIKDYIDQHLKIRLVPHFNSIVCEILSQHKTKSHDLSDSKIYLHELRLQFNTYLLERLEKNLRKQGRLNTSASSNESGVIRKTAPKAG